MCFTFATDKSIHAVPVRSVRMKKQAADSENDSLQAIEYPQFQGK